MMQILDLYKGLISVVFPKKIAICGRAKVIWNFSENSSDFVAPPFPKVLTKVFF